MTFKLAAFSRRNSYSSDCWRKRRRDRCGRLRSAHRKHRKGFVNSLGDTDWETGRPTAGRTFSNFGLDATDLGYPVEHAGKLILLFGDSWPPRHPGGAIREVPPTTRSGWSFGARRRPTTAVPGDAGSSKIRRRRSRRLHNQSRAIKQGSFFNVPSAASAAPTASTHSSGPIIAPIPIRCALAGRSAGAPRGRSEVPGKRRSQTALAAASWRAPRRRSHLQPCGPDAHGFVYSTAINARLQTICGGSAARDFHPRVPRFRASVPYLAQAPTESFGNSATWRFFTGRASNGQPQWVTHEEWMRGAAHQTRRGCTSGSRPENRR